MTLTMTTTLDDAVVTRYVTKFNLANARPGVWAQFVDWQEPVAEDGNAAASYNYGAYLDMPLAVTELSEDSDVTPVALGDTNTTVTPHEYGSAVALTKKLRLTARTMVKSDAATILGKNRVQSVDYLIRQTILGGSNVRYVGTCGARTDLDATSDKVTYEFLLMLHAAAMGMGMEPWEGNNYVSVIHPLLEVDIRQLAQVLGYEYYRPEQLFQGLPGGTFAGFRFIPDVRGKLYMGGGTVAQTTTLAAAAAAGDTTITVASDAGIAVGDYLTIGTLEGVDTEQVKVTDISATPVIGVLGAGNGNNNNGLSRNHALGAAVTEAANAAAIPVIGKNSCPGVYGAETGKYGRPTLAQNLDLLGRFVYPGWYWFGGVGRWERLLIRGECAVGNGWIGPEMGV